MLTLALHALLLCVPALGQFGLPFCRNECVFQLFADPTDGKTIEVTYFLATSAQPHEKTVSFVNGRAQFFYTTDERATGFDDKVSLIVWNLGLPYEGCRVDALDIAPTRGTARRCVDLKQKCGNGPSVTALTVYTDVYCRCTTGFTDLDPVRMVSGIPGERPC